MVVCVVGAASTIAFAVLFLARHSFLGAQVSNFVALAITRCSTPRPTAVSASASAAGTTRLRHQLVGLGVFVVDWVLTAASLALLHAVAPKTHLWEHFSLAALPTGTGVIYLWNLSINGWANSFYSAGIQAGSESWKAWLFGWSDMAASITVDKPPASLWIPGLSARIFGVNSWSIPVPEALMYLAFGPGGWLHRLGQLFAALGAMIVSAGWWILAVELWPPSSRWRSSARPDVPTPAAHSSWSGVCGCWSPWVPSASWRGSSTSTTPRLSPPAVAALVAGGATVCWSHRGRLWVRLALGASVWIAAIWASSCSTGPRVSCRGCATRCW